MIKGEAYFVIILNIDDHIMFGIALNKYHRKLDLSHQSADNKIGSKLKTKQCKGIQKHK